MAQYRRKIRSLWFAGFKSFFTLSCQGEEGATDMISTVPSESGMISNVPSASGMISVVPCAAPEDLLAAVAHEIPSTSGATK